MKNTRYSLRNLQFGQTETNKAKNASAQVAAIRQNAR
jgi:hypothetical protein